MAIRDVLAKIGGTQADEAPRSPQLREPLSPSVVSDPERLAQAYQAFWRLGEGDPLEAYHSALAEIREAEVVLPGERVRAILKQASKRWYGETGRCPFCGGPELHSPAEAIVEGAA